MSEPKARNAPAITTTLTPRASKRGKKRCRLLCRGHTMAMMNSAKATRAKTDRAMDKAATATMVAIRTCAPWWILPLVIGAPQIPSVSSSRSIVELLPI